jgi:type III secretory pathway lipoprotein EscJ
MTSMVQVAVAGDVTEAEEIQAILAEAGIAAELQPEAEADALAVLVPEGQVDLAQDAIEAMIEPDEPVAGL